MNLIGFLGVDKDSRGFNDKRWSRFRPSIAICAHEELNISNYYIIYQNKFKDKLEFLVSDIKSINPKINIIPVEINFSDIFDPMETLEKQLEFVSSLDEEQEYLINISTGTHTNALAWFKLVEGNFINAKLLQVSKDGNIDVKYGRDNIPKGSYKIIDFKLSKYDRYFYLLNQDKVQSNDFLKLGIDTRNKDYNDMISMIEKITIKNNHSILIDGPSGAGKTNLVQNIYDLKKSKSIIDGELQYVNCGTLRSDSAQSVLFGHKKGAFTGANDKREGLIKLANNGILFLDEIGNLSLDVQVMLLDALEKKEFYPMGSDKVEKSDFTLFCGTNVNLHEEVEKGNFREDLLARINLWHFTLPGLKDRKEDIEPNIAYELIKQERELGIKVRFNKDAKNKYLKFATSEKALWKRNFRDLSASIIRMITLSENGFIDDSCVNDEILRLEKSWGIQVNSTDINLENYLGDMISEVTKIDLMVLEETIRICLASKTAAEAARSLYSNKYNEDLSKNPSGRLNKYLSKYKLSFKIISNKY